MRIDKVTDYMSRTSPSRTSLSGYVRTLARGPGRSRNLTGEEAYEAMSIILKGDAPPEAIGALLMLMRFRGENADEIAGFIRATHETLPPWMGDLGITLDWPSYAAGRTRGLPFFLLSALLLAENDIPVFMHGFNSHHMQRLSSTEAALAALGITPATNEQQVRQSLAANNFAYMPLAALSPAHYELINLRDVLGLRSPVNTLLRGLNPARAAASIIGVFHPPYVPLQVETAIRMQNGDAIIFKGGGGEAERTPLKPVKMAHTKSGSPDEVIFGPLLDKANFDTKPEEPDPEHLRQIWAGEVSDEKAEATIIASAAAALYILKRASSPEGADNLARSMWTAHQNNTKPAANTSPPESIPAAL